MKKTWVILLVLLMALSACSRSGKDTGDKKYHIGVIQLAEHPALDSAYEGMKDALEKELGKDNVKIDYKNAQGEIANVEQMVSGFVNDKVDLIYAIATNAAQSAYNATEGTGIPVVFNAVTDPISAGIVKNMDASGTHSTGVSDISPVEKQLAIVTEILPNAKRVGIMYDVGESNSTYQIGLIKEAAKNLGLEIVDKGVSDSADIPLVAKSLVAEVDALFNITDNTMVAATSTLVGIANDAKIPVFASEDGQMDLGLLAAESLSYYALGEKAGEMIKSILVDETKVETMPVAVVENTNLYVNEEVAEMLGIELPKTITDRMNK